tara:strand:- start:77 stop:502 length:426 start_codon:yes stop_codon:yes gene_type:complete
MTKVQKIFTIDDNLVEELKLVKNKSKLVNELLKDYFSKGSLKVKEELLAKMANLRRDLFNQKEQLINYEATLKKLEEKEKSIESLYSNLPKDILDDFKMFPALSEEGLINRYQGIYADKYKISYNEIKAAYDNYYNDKEEN